MKITLPILMFFIFAIAFSILANPPQKYRYFCFSYIVEGNNRWVNGDIGIWYEGFPTRKFIDSCVMKVQTGEMRNGRMTIKSIFEFKNQLDYNAFYLK